MNLQHLHGVAIVIFMLSVYVSAQGNWQNQQFSNNNQGDSCCEEYCYATDEEPYIYFGTKTAYDSLNRRSNSQQHVVPDCTPVQFWSIIRHGTRFPSADKINKFQGLTRLHQEIVENYQQKRSYPDRGRLCRDDYNLFANWRFNTTVTQEKAKSLTTQGVEDLKLLARRYKSKYPQIFQETYDEKVYYFQYVDTDRTRESYQAYIEGLFGPEFYRVHANTVNDERLTKPDENCKKLQDVRQNQPIGFMNEYTEYTRFLDSAEYKKMVHDVLRRLGFLYDLNATIVEDIYDLCRYEKAWNVQQRSPWCIAFTETQLKLLEYTQDLKHYYKSGYGSKVSEKMGCSPVKDFYERFEKTVNGDNSGSRATFYFTKASTLLNVLTAMGIGRDYPPIPTDPSRRKWRTSELSPFAANLAATLYQCRGGADKFKVMFFLNEVPVEFPECSVGLCTWSAVEQKFQGLVKNCNADDPCRENSAPASNMNFVLYTLSVAVLLYLKV